MAITFFLISRIILLAIFIQVIGGAPLLIASALAERGGRSDLSSSLTKLARVLAYTCDGLGLLGIVVAVIAGAMRSFHH